jgi:threonine dehydrogenase-like Zn-dependent dehydrogenase
VIKKQLYTARLADGGRGVGSAALIVRSGEEGIDLNIMVRTSSLPGGVVDKVGLTSVNGSWAGQVVICETGGIAGNCNYAPDGNVSHDASITPTMINLAGITPGAFFDSLIVPAGQPSNVKVVLNDGDLGQGTLVRAF